jgi:hypothetical protein
MSLILQGSTSGSVTLQEPAVAGTTVLTLPAATGTVMVSGNMPAFSAYQSSVQTLVTNTNTKINFQTKEYDTANAFDATTNYRFTPQVAGYYQVSGCFHIGATACGIRLQIFVNGAVYKVIFNALGATVNAASGSALVYLNGSTDYVELFGFVGVGQVLVATIDTTYFQASMVRAA